MAETHSVRASAFLDREGMAAFSPLVLLTPDAVLASGLSAAPNPFAGPLAVQIRTPQAGEIILLVLDIVGRTGRQRSFSAPGAGAHDLRLEDTGVLPTGSYTLVARQGVRLATLHRVCQ